MLMCQDQVLKPKNADRRHPLVCPIVKVFHFFLEVLRKGLLDPWQFHFGSKSEKGEGTSGAVGYFANFRHYHQCSILDHALPTQGAGPPSRKFAIQSPFAAPNGELIDKTGHDRP